MKKFLTLTLLSLLVGVSAQAEDKFYLSGCEALTGFDWGLHEENLMTNTSGKIWTWTRENITVSSEGEVDWQFKVVKNDWNIGAWPSSNYKISNYLFKGTCKVTITFDTSADSGNGAITNVEVIQTDITSNYYIYGGTGDWSLTQMEKQADNVSFKATINCQNNTGNWYGFVVVPDDQIENGTTVKSGYWNNSFKPAQSGNWNLKMQNFDGVDAAKGNYSGNSDIKWFIANGINVEFTFYPLTSKWSSKAFIQKEIVANDRNIATFGLPETYGQVQVPSGVAVYKAASINGTTIQLQKVTEDTGVISLDEGSSVGFAIVGTPGTYRFEATEGVAVSLDGNLFVGTGTDANAEAPAESYVLGNTTTGGLAFYHTDAPKKLGALKAYIEGGTSAKTVLFWDETNGIANLSSEKTDNVYYDLQGRRVMNPTKGLFIVNGKKVIK